MYKETVDIREVNQLVKDGWLLLGTMIPNYYSKSDVKYMLERESTCTISKTRKFMYKHITPMILPTLAITIIAFIILGIAKLINLI